MEKETSFSSFRWVLYTLAVALILVLNLWTSWVFELERKIAITLQKASLVPFANFMSDKFLIGSMAVYFFFTYNLESYRPRFYYEVLLALAGIAFIAILKLVFAQGRPYQRFLDVMPLACECDYGMPSGHSFTVVLMSYLIYYRCTEWLWPET